MNETMKERVDVRSNDKIRTNKMFKKERYLIRQDDIIYSFSIITNKNNSVIFCYT